MVNFNEISQSPGIVDSISNVFKPVYIKAYFRNMLDWRYICRNSNHMIYSRNYYMSVYFTYNTGTNCITITNMVFDDEANMQIFTPEMYKEIVDIFKGLRSFIHADLKYEYDSIFFTVPVRYDFNHFEYVTKYRHLKNIIVYAMTEFDKFYNGLCKHELPKDKNFVLVYNSGWECDKNFPDLEKDGFVNTLPVITDSFMFANSIPDISRLNYMTKFNGYKMIKLCKNT